MAGRPYLIFTTGRFKRSSGGLVALHKLCHDLRMLGEAAWVTHGPSEPTFQAPRRLPTARELHRDFIVVYPELVVGNPLGCPRVVRWLLNTPELTRSTGFYQREQASDLIFRFSNYFDYRGLGRDLGLLKTLYTDYRTFRDHGGLRSGSCYLVKKGKVTNPPAHPADSVLLGEHNDWEAAARLLNQKEIFYCYDTACYWATLAALCGCPALVIPDGRRTPADWHAAFPNYDYGVAYGPEELPHARATVPRVADHLRSLEARDLGLIHEFVRRTQSAFADASTPRGSAPLWPAARLWLWGAGGQVEKLRRSLGKRWAAVRGPRPR